MEHINIIELWATRTRHLTLVRCNVKLSSAIYHVANPHEKGMLKKT